eukprot:CAMPEP_0116579506 /NCGR_PEP_ID=MMETSP0397-20121206/22286_1 /TAXON_ID=216820 /ORGANISM="Cyclophora tenuis, Strain ECT3854" /LENGTH=169 /DNA_ID=CAMNT_0004108987 /DNA_START=182 /DNA_END=692 /DNA_ORIENTATION=-
MAKDEESDFDQCIGWQDLVEELDENQTIFANFLRAYASTAVMEVWYEDLDGPHGDRTFNAIIGFLGLQNNWNQPEIFSVRKYIPIKAGKRTCAERIDGLGENFEPMVEGSQSHLACTMLSVRYNNATPTLQYLPPSNNAPCRYRFNCGREIKPCATRLVNKLRNLQKKA